MFKTIKRWLFGSPTFQFQKKKILWNDDYCIENGEGEYNVVDFTGHISFDIDTECDVEHATFILVIRSPSDLEEENRKDADRNNGNMIYWKDGVVTKGNLHCQCFSKGEFRGRSLLVRGKMEGVFKGVFLSQGSLY